MESRANNLESQLLRLPEIAVILGIGLSSTQKLVAEGTFPVIRFGRAVRVPRSAVEAWIKRQVIQLNEGACK